MTTEYTKDDDMQTLRLWYDAKPFTKELETEIRAIPTTAFSDDTVEDYIQERLKENNWEYENPLQKEEPKLDLTAPMLPQDDEEELKASDIQKELEAKLDEIFGPLDDSE